MPPFGVPRLNGNDVNSSRVWVSTFRPNPAFGEQAERYPAAIKIQAILRGFIVRIRELNSVLLHTVKNATWRLVSHNYQSWGDNSDFVPNLQFNNKSPRYLHNTRFNPPENSLAFNKFIQALVRERWDDRRVILQDWFGHRKRVGIKLLDFDTPDAPQPSTNPACKRLRLHVPLRERISPRTFHDSSSNYVPWPGKNPREEF